MSCLIFKSILKNRHETKEYECTAGLWCGDRDYPVNDLVVFGDNIGTGGKSRDRSDKVGYKKGGCVVNSFLWYSH